MKRLLFLLFPLLIFAATACEKTADVAATMTAAQATADTTLWTVTPTITKTPTLRPTNTPKPNLGSTVLDLKTFMEPLGCTFEWWMGEGKPYGLNESVGICSPQTSNAYANLISLSIGFNSLPDEDKQPDEDDYVVSAQVCSLLRQAPTSEDRALSALYMKSLAIAATPLWREGEQWVYDNIEAISQENPTIEQNIGRFTATLFWSKLECTDVPNCQSVCFRLAINEK
jgi:hypothetical protein